MAKLKKKDSIPKRFEAGFLTKLDQRTELYKTLKANYEQIVDDLGGKQLSLVKATLVERFVWLTALVQSLEQRLMDEGTDAMELGKQIISATGILNRLANTIGLDRVPAQAPWILEQGVDDVA